MQGIDAAATLAPPGADADKAANLCPVCGSRMIATKSWLLRCPACRFLASSLRPGAGTGIEGLEALRRANFERLLDRLQTHRALRSARLLEVGCAQGLFLEAAARRGADVTGIEPESRNAARARGRGFRVEDGFFPQDLAHKGPYDIVAFNDVFEHLPRPAQALQAVEQLLSPGGIVILNLPTSDGFLYKTAALLDRAGFGATFDRLWQRGLPSPHVSYFNECNLCELVRAHTRLTILDRMRLRSVERNGLYERVTSVNGGAVGNALFAGAWVFSFVAEMLPSDIMALFLARA